jgi:hypothetical protein
MANHATITVAAAERQKGGWRRGHLESQSDPPSLRRTENGGTAHGGVVVCVRGAFKFAVIGDSRIKPSKCPKCPVTVPDTLDYRAFEHEIEGKEQKGTFGL